MTWRAATVGLQVWASAGRVKRSTASLSSHLGGSRRGRVNQVPEPVCKLCTRIGFRRSQVGMKVGEAAGIQVRRTDENGHRIDGPGGPIEVPGGEAHEVSEHPTTDIRAVGGCRCRMQ